MTAAATSTAHYNPLTIQKSYAEYLDQLNRLTQCAWQIAYTALWNTQQFTAPEIDTAIEHIRSFLMQQQNCKQQYILFAQRVLLARQYISSHPGTYIPYLQNGLAMIIKMGSGVPKAGWRQCSKQETHNRHSKRLSKLFPKQYGKPYKQPALPAFINGEVILFSKKQMACSTSI